MRKEIVRTKKHKLWEEVLDHGELPEGRVTTKEVISQW